MSTDTGSDGWPAGVGRRILAETDSTNSEAMRLAPTLAGPEWVLALRQNAGRGRRGRPWADPPGNFSATLILRPTERPEQVALRSFVAALALWDAVQAATGRADNLALKWPNDVLLDGGKLAGILLESAGAGQGVNHLCIGIGVNLISAPDPATTAPGSAPATHLKAASGVDISPEEFLDLIAPAYAYWEAQFVTYGFARVREAWLARAARLGEVIEARTMRESLTGTFETIDEAGNLILRTATGRQAIAAADVFFSKGDR